MILERLTAAGKVWFGFSLVVVFLGLALLVNHHISENDAARGGLNQELRRAGEPLEDCLVRIQEKNPSYTADLVERLCTGR